MFGGATRRKAVAYYRHSAEDKQENSVPLQREQTQAFADKHDIEIIREESDEGKSGLSASRPGFERLFDEWVLHESAEQFDYVFVLDWTRWGRWQDTDEAAYWTFICKKHGKQVVYIKVGFPEEEHKLLSSLETSIGRYMAAEYSRQLSDKVWYGSIKVSEQGFSAGGTAPYGYNRVLFDEHKQRIGVLKPGEHKVIANQRVTFEPATDGTQDIVKEIFTTFVSKWIHPRDIADSLNERDILSATGRKWDTSKVIRVLSNETYTGTRVYNKTWKRLKQKQHKNPAEEWVRTLDAFEALVDSRTFEAAQERLYWLIPSRWRYGMRKITRTQIAMRDYTAQLIRHYGEDERYAALKQLPVSYGLTYYRAGVAQRCFRITEDMRRYKNVIGVSISMFAKDTVDAVFSLPTEKFGVGDFLVLPDSDKSLANYLLDDDMTARELISICDAIPS